MRKYLGVAAGLVILLIAAEGLAGDWKVRVSSVNCLTAADVTVGCASPLATKKIVGYEVVTDKGVSVSQALQTFPLEFSDAAIFNSLQFAGNKVRYPNPAPPVLVPGQEISVP